MPTRLTASVHVASSGQESETPVRIVSAGMGATRPALLMLAPAEAAVWLMLFSSIPQGRPPTLSKALKNPKLNNMAVIDMLKPQPIFRPV